MSKQIEKIGNVIKVNYLDQTIWMPLDRPVNVSGSPIDTDICIDDVINTDKEPDYDAYTVYMTRKCNYACSYCFVNKGATDSIVSVQDLIEFIKSRNKKKIQLRFFGGEPLLKINEIKEWVAELNLLRNEGYKISYGVVTNASLLDADAVDFFYNNKFIVIISHELSDELQEKNRIADKKLQDKAIENIQYLAKTKLVHRATVRCMLDPMSKVTILDRLNYAVDMGLSGIQFDIPHVGENSEHRFTEETISKLRNQIQEATKFYVSKIKEHDYRYLGLYNIDNLLKIWILNNKYIDYDTCGFSINHFAVDVDGTIYPCQNFAGIKDFRIGDINTKEIYKSFDTSIEKHKVCEECSVKELCTKRCYYSNYIGCHDIYTPNNAQCEMKKEFIAAAIYTLYEIRKDEKLFEDYCVVLKAKNKFLR